MTEVEMAGYGPCLDNNDNEIYAKKKHRKWSCTRMTAGCSCLLSIVTGVFVVFLTIQVITFRKNLLIETESRRNESDYRLNTPQFEFLKDDLGVSGTFGIEQHILDINNTIRWMADSSSSISPVPTEPCLIIPVSGKYLIVSRFTFSVSPTNDVPLLNHYLKVNKPDGEFIYDSYRRKLVSLPVGKNVNKGSVFIEFYDIKANEQICVNTSHPQLLFASTVDNDVNIIKL